MHTQSIGKWLAVLVITVLLPLVASNAQAIFLNEAVDSAIKTYPEVEVAAHRAKAAHFEYRQEQSRYFPSVDLEHRYGIEYNNTPTTRGNPGNYDDWMESSSTAIVATQTIFDLTRNFSIENVKAVRNSSRFDYLDTTEIIGS